MIFQQESHHSFHPHAGIAKHTSPARFVFGKLARTCAWLSDIGARRRQRLDLRALDDRMLADLGLSRGDVSSETAKWPWQP